MGKIRHSKYTEMFTYGRVNQRSIQQKYKQQ
jgi:hypothetical protein